VSVVPFVTGGAGEPSGSPDLFPVRQSRVVRPLDWRRLDGLPANEQEFIMPKQSPSVRATSPFNADPVSASDRLDAIGRYINLRDWSFAVIDLMEVAGKAMTGGDPIIVCDPTLTGVSGLLRDLLLQMDERVDIIKAP